MHTLQRTSTRVGLLLLLAFSLLPFAALSQSEGLELAADEVWVLQWLGDVDAPQRVLRGTQITANFNASFIRGSAGCNTYFGTYDLEGDAISVRALGATRVFCAEPPGIMEQEQQYLGALEAAERFERQNSRLDVLYDGGAKALTYFLEGEETADPLSGTRWVLEYLGDSTAIQPVLPGLQVTLNFTGGRLNGNGGCNDYSGSYEVDGDTLSVTPLATTRKLCDDLTNQLENGYLPALQAATSFELDGDRLKVVTTAGATILSFVAADQVLVGTTWVLTSFGRPANPDPVLESAQITLSFAEDGSLSGDAGCNTYFGNYVTEGATLTVSQLGSTLQACPSPIDQQEFDYLHALQSADSFRRNFGNRLQVFYDGFEHVLNFVAIEGALADTTWTLETISDADGSRGPLPGTEVILAFDGEGGLSGSSGCNSYFGSVQIDGNTLSVSEALGATLKLCADPVMEQERAYLIALTGAETFRLVGDRLVIESTGGATLTFVLQRPEGAVSPAAAQAQLPEQIWVLVAFAEVGGSEPILPGTEITLSFADNGQLGGNAGCNNYFGSFEINGGRLSVSPLGTTRKFCGEPEGVMDQENRYLSALAAASSFRLLDGQLEVFYNDDTAALVFEPQGAERPEQPADNLLADTAWVLDTMVSDDIAEKVLEDTQITLNFDAEGGLNGNAGCNGYFGGYQVDGNRLSVSEALGVTARACPEPIMEQEARYLGALVSAQTYEIVDGQLQINADFSPQLLIFNAAGEDSQAEISAVEPPLVETPETPEAPAVEKTLFLGPIKIECTTVALQLCWLISDQRDGAFGLSSNPVEGFDYQWGIFYELRIRETRIANPPADASSLRWELIEVVSEEPVTPGTQFDLALTSDAIQEVEPNLFEFHSEKSFVCPGNLDCDSLRLTLMQPGHIQFVFQFPDRPDRPLVLVSWELAS